VRREAVSIDTPKKGVWQARKTYRKLVANGFQVGTGLHIASVYQRGKGCNRVATITVGRSDFYDPMQALRLSIENLADPDRMPKPVKHVDASGVSYAPPSQDKSRPERIPIKAFIRRARQRCPENCIRYWMAKRPTYGMFFLYKDRVVLDTYTHERGFLVQVVPECGVDLTA
jgi:hypothetical protein